jgi:hypothetical protein
MVVHDVDVPNDGWQYIGSILFCVSVPAHPGFNGVVMIMQMYLD